MFALPSSTIEELAERGRRPLVKQVLRLDEPGTRSDVRYRGPLIGARFRLPRRFSTRRVAFARSLI
jgi:hypothetical protein